MSDLACWRIIADDHEGYVVRIHGGEHYLNDGELLELQHHLSVVYSQGGESFGEGYHELQSDREAQATQPRGGLLAKLGLKREASIKRRQV